MKKRAAACTVTTAAVIGVVSACGSPITANRDWTGLATSITAEATITTVGQTIHEQEQHLLGGLTNGGSSWSDVRARTSVEVDCLRTSISQPIGSERWNCQITLNTGDRFYVAQGRTADGVFGTFTSLDRAGSRATITITKVREVKQPPTVILRPVPLRAGQTVDGGRGYLIRISARVG